MYKEHKIQYFQQERYSNYHNLLRMKYDVLSLSDLHLQIFYKIKIK